MQNLPDLPRLSHTQKDKLIRTLWPLQQQIVELMAQMLVMQNCIKHLDGLMALNSKNFSNPPLSDSLNKPAPRSLRVAGEATRGGEKGHSSSALCKGADPDNIVIHNVADQCRACQRELPFAYVSRTRQVSRAYPASRHASRL